MFISLEALQAHSLGGFIEVLLCRHDWLNYWTLLTKPVSSPFPLPRENELLALKVPTLESHVGLSSNKSTSGSYLWASRHQSSDYAGAGRLPPPRSGASRGAAVPVVRSFCRPRPRRRDGIIFENRGPGLLCLPAHVAASALWFRGDDGHKH